MIIKEDSQCFLYSDEGLAFDPTKAKIFAGLSAAAYAESKYLQKCIQRVVPGEDYSLVVAIGSKCNMGTTEYKECFAFVAISKTRKEILISFRGTAGDNDQIVDEALHWGKVPFGDNDVRVNKYFNNSFTKLYDPCVLNSVKELVVRNRDYNVVVTGHSLGGAMASLAAYALVTRNVVDKRRLFLYTYGMPRVGNKEYAYYHDRLVSNSWRIINGKDIVPRLPLISQGFYHHQKAVLYLADMTPTSRYNIYPDNEDPETMKGVGSKPDHKTYFGIPIGTFCETDLNYNPTMESRFQVNRCQVVSAQELDDMALAETTIKNVSESVCDFTRDFCDWIRTPNITFNFQRKNGPSDSNKKTGPSADRHNSASGYYVYADASDNEHKIAKLRSPNFVSGNYCIEFYYHMFGDDMGSLELLMYTSKTPRKAVFKKEGNQDNHWRHERGTVDTTKLGSADMHFEFVATIGKGYRSDIAIDFVSILKGKC
ncbi:hypothetical protein DPMN_050738 [Dreissena polymorpha]|uniref:MAM domain-containing protein n=2 Tax=Dreissena polymorpha TaxID=45954 RepID=A0A9D4CIP6_DREPO|nr:hypothetical protein DPMN_050738 [Dreissena polymorpha]